MSCPRRVANESSLLFCGSFYFFCRVDFAVWKKCCSDIESAEPHPKNLAPVGPSSRILEAICSPSMRGGGWISLSFLKYRQVIRMGIGAFLGGMITRTPEWRHPRIAPPRASTMKLTKNLAKNKYVRTSSLGNLWWTENVKQRRTRHTKCIICPWNELRLHWRRQKRKRLFYFKEKPGWVHPIISTWTKSNATFPPK